MRGKLFLLKDNNLMKPPIIAHIKNTALKEKPTEKKLDLAGTIERAMLKIIWHVHRT